MAALDYLTEKTDLLKNPQIIDYSLLDNIRKRSNEDPKTGCYNSGFLNEFAIREINRAKRYYQQLSLIIADVDDFKTINDQFGHIFGDLVLKNFAGAIKDSIRNEDYLFRFGGDEFVIILPQTGRTGARCLAERVKLKINERFKGTEYLDKGIEFGFSAGIATYPIDGDNYEKLLASADSALYKSKQMGKNRIFDYFDKDYGIPLEIIINEYKHLTKIRTCSNFRIKTYKKIGLHKDAGNIIQEKRIKSSDFSNIRSELEKLLTI